MDYATLYQLAKEYAMDEIKFDKDDGYGCGFTSIMIKYSAFSREMKKFGLAKKDCYYGWILDGGCTAHATLLQEKYNHAFVTYLIKFGVMARVATRLD